MNLKNLKDRLTDSVFSRGFSSETKKEVVAKENKK